MSCSAVGRCAWGPTGPSATVLRGIARLLCMRILSVLGRCRQCQLPDSTQPAHIGKARQGTLALADTSRSQREGNRQVLVPDEDVPSRTLVGKVFSCSRAARVHPFAASPLQPTSACDTLS